LSKPAKTRSVEEINEKIRKGDAQVLTAEEMKKLVEAGGVAGIKADQRGNVDCRCGRHLDNL